MSICIDKRQGYAKLDQFCFTIGSGVDPKTIIDFGDGSTEEVGNRNSVCHVYVNFGTYDVCLRSCESGNIIDQCIKVIATPYVSESIEVLEFEETGLASKNEGEQFVVRVVTNCPPPIKVKVELRNTISPPIEDIRGETYEEFLPKHYFITDEKMEDEFFILDDVSNIYVNDILVGYSSVFSFGLYDDYPSVKEIELTLERVCELDPQIDWTAFVPQEDNCYLNCTEHPPLIDPDLGF